MWGSERRRLRHGRRSHGWYVSASALLAAVMMPGASAAQADLGEREAERARHGHRMPTDAELARVPVPRAPRLDQLPAPASTPPVDLGALAAGFAPSGVPGAFEGTSKPTLLVFISFTMPEATLRRLAEQASASGAVLVLRGLVNGSLVETAARVQALIGRTRVDVRIDPQAFERYGVVRVPAFVLARSVAVDGDCTTARCSSTHDFAKVVGDVSLPYALRQLQTARQIRHQQIP